MEIGEEQEKYVPYAVKPRTTMVKTACAMRIGRVKLKAMAFDAHRRCWRRRDGETEPRTVSGSRA